MIKKLTCITLLLSITLATGCASPAFAQTSTPSSALTASVSSSLKEKLDQLKKEVASKAALLKQEVNKKMVNKFYIGTVISIDETTIKFSTNKGVKIVNINEFTNYQSKIKLPKKTTSTAKSISPDDYITALGDVDDNGALVAKKIVKLNKVASDEAKLIIGKVDSVSNPNINLKLPQDNTMLKIITSASTDFLLGSDEASLADIKLDKFLIAKGEVSKDGSLKARFIYLFPTVTTSSKISTSSGTKKVNRN